MKELADLKKDVAEMSGHSLKMFELTHRAFMEHDTDIIAMALGHETFINDMEKSITTDLVAFGRSYATKEERAKIAVYADIVGDLELIGDYCKDILERVQIKIEEKLLFIEEEVKEYNQLYELTLVAFKEVSAALAKNDLSLLKDVLAKDRHIDSLVDDFRQKHNHRLIEGICSPMACNMYLNMLDFTAAIYYHIKKISRSLSKIKNG